MVDESTHLVELIHGSSILKKRLCYPRFVSDELTILILDSNYHLVAEVRNAFARRGHKVISIPVAKDSGAMVNATLRALAEAQPDFLFTVNFLGFDQEGILGTILETLQVPVAVWLVDSPLFILRGRPVPAPSTSQIFCWEKAYIPALQKSCECHYLPLATEPSVLGGQPSTDALDVSFVGDSGHRSQQKWKRRLAPEDESIVEDLAKTFTKGPHHRLREALCNPSILSELLSDPSAVDRWAAATWRANSRQRATFIRALQSLPLRVYGDEGWRIMLPSAPVEPGPTYGPQLAKVYQSSAVNLNITSLQMPSGLNQRIFDVPAAGGFLLTDGQEDLYDFFTETDVVTWSTLEEAQDKALFYLQRPNLRRKIIHKCQQTIISAHTYSHRVQELLSVLRKRFGPTRFSPVPSGTPASDDARTS
ncbi:MAG: glycosyltransferase [Myxococcales bacterium]|nr:glycosyltransferase [Myxococcales bacterium]